MHSLLRTFLAFALLADLAGETAVASPRIDAARARTLEAMVRQDCGSCHGMSLKGGLGPDLRAAQLSSRSPEIIANIILDGVPGTPMPPWRPLLSEEDALWIARYLKEVRE